MSDRATKAIEVFYSYAREDEDLRDKLINHLSILRRQGLIKEWYDRQILPGTARAREIDSHLNTASIILLLVSADFIASNYCYDVEMARAMERHYANNACVIPIILRPVDWQQAPFAELQALPTDAKPITTWPNCDEAFLNVVKGIRQAIEQMNTYCDLRDTTRLPHDAISYFMPIARYLERRFPTEKDFEQGLVYLPKKYAETIKCFLHKDKRVLLVGQSAAGKTVTAIALAKQLQKVEGYKVNYKDAGRAEAGDGRKWHQLVHAHDRKGVLYILDNCHLAAKEVNEFCFQWEENPPVSTQCLLISRPDTEELDAQSEVINYFEMCMDATIKIQPEDIYWGIIETYTTAYRQQDPERYIALEDDSVALLQRQHAHDLVNSKSRLQAWHNLGGRLSEVKKEAVYQGLLKKYLPSSRDAMPSLCVLRQYEIRAHSNFVEKVLLWEEVKQLQKEKLLTSSLVQNYGVLYDLLLHPAQARELFEAYMYRQGSSITRQRIERGIVKTLRTYLKTVPPNYMEVYEGLARQKQKTILQQLLRDHDLQVCAASQFAAENISDAIRYVYRMSKVDLSRARELLSMIVEDVEIQSISSQIAGYAPQHIVLLLQQLQQIDIEIADRVVIAIDMMYLSLKMKKENIPLLLRLVRTLKQISPEQASILLLNIPVDALVTRVTIYNVVSIIVKLQKIEYSQIKTFVELLDVAQLAQQIEKVSFQHLFWSLHALKTISPSQAKTFLEQILIQGSTARAIVSDCNSVEKIVGFMQELGYTHAQIKGFIDTLDIEQIVQKASNESLQHLYWFARTLQKTAPSTAKRFFEVLTPSALASLCHSKGATISILGQFVKVSTEQFRRLFLQQFSDQEIADICNRSSLGSIGSSVQYGFPFFERGYLLFQEQFLAARLLTETLEEIGKFICRIQLVPGRGREYARKVLDLLISVDLSERVASDNLRKFALLLHHATSVDRVYAVRLLTLLRRSDILQAAIEKSDLGGIQMLIYNVAAIDKDYLQFIQQELEISDLTDKLATAQVRDLSLFLWNVYVYIDRELSQGYCKIVDMQQRSYQLQDAHLEDLCLFLWSIISISNFLKLRTFNDTIIEERLVVARRLEPGLAAALLGIVALAQPTASKYALLQPIEQERLTSWLKSAQKLHPYILALALYGLKSYNEREAEIIIHKCLPVAQASLLLASASASAMTPQSKMLLEEVLKWLGRLSREKNRG
jgi:hypothetical protein